MGDSIATYAVEPMLLDAKAAAQFLGIGKTLFYRLSSTGELGPQAVHLGRRSLWRRHELEEWIAAGCPRREVWVRQWSNPK